MNIQNRMFFYGRAGQQVTVDTGCHYDGITVRIHGHEGVTQLNGEHFADVLSALVVGVDHIEGLPGFCQCEPCRVARGKVFADQLVTAQAERLAAATSGRFTCPNSEGHPFLACTDNAVICQVCGCHQGNHDK